MLVLGCMLIIRMIFVILERLWLHPGVIQHMFKVKVEQCVLFMFKEIITEAVS